MKKFDAIDRALIKELQIDSKQTAKALSLKLNLSVTAIFERIKKLENSGVIKKYVALVDNTKINRSFVVFCQIKLVQHSRDYVVKFEKEVKGLNEVMECYHISGDYDYLLKILVKDIKEFREFMVAKLTRISHIGSTHSSFMIDEVKQTNVIHL